MSKIDKSRQYVRREKTPKWLEMVTGRAGKKLH